METIAQKEFTMMEKVVLNYVKKAVIFYLMIMNGLHLENILLKKELIDFSMSIKANIKLYLKDINY